MIKIIKEIVLTLCLFVVSPVMGANNVSSNEASGQSGFDWNPVIQAIVQVESEGNTKADNNEDIATPDRISVSVLTTPPTRAIE